LGDLFTVIVVAINVNAKEEGDGDDESEQQVDNIGGGRSEGRRGLGSPTSNTAATIGR